MPRKKSRAKGKKVCIFDTMPILPHVYLYAHVCGTNRTLYGQAETWQLNFNITKCYDLKDY